MSRVGSATVLLGVCGLAFNRRKVVRAADLGQEGKAPRTVVVIGGGVIGLSTSLQLAERGVAVTLLESRDKVAQLASNTNGAIICPSMTASWASARLLAKNPGEVKKMHIGWGAWTDPGFYRWSAWFWLNSLVPGRADRNHESQRQLGHFSLQCMEKEQHKYGKKVFMNRTAVETIKIYHDKNDLEAFLQSDQALFWKQRGMEFQALTAAEVVRLEPALAGVEEEGGRGLVGGVRHTMDTSGDINMYCNNIEALCKEKGVKILKNTQVKKLQKEGSIIRGVELSSGEVVSGDAYVLAAGVGSAALARQVGVNLPIIPMKGHMATVKSREGSNPMRRNIYSLNHGLLSPLGPNLLRIAGRVEAVGYDFTVEESKGHDLAVQIEPVFKKGYFDYSQVSYHSCLRPVCGDDVPVIGKTHISNLFVNSGHGSKGWTHSWGSAVLLAEVITGEATSLDSHRYTPRRFHPVRTFLGL